MVQLEIKLIGMDPTTLLSERKKSTTKLKR